MGIGNGGGECVEAFDIISFCSIDSPNVVGGPVGEFLCLGGWCGGG